MTIVCAVEDMSGVVMACDIRMAQLLRYALEPPYVRVEWAQP